MNRMKRLAALLLAAIMVFSLLPVTALATEDGGSAEHVQCAKDTACTYEDGHEGNCSTFVKCAKSEGCTYAENHDGNCSDYVAPETCEHGVAKTDACADCAAAQSAARVKAVQDLIDALPEVTAENKDTVTAQMEAIDTAKSGLSDDECGQLDAAKYLSAAQALSELSGEQPGGEPDVTDVVYVAHIGTQGYETLAAAIAAAGDGDTITLADGTHTMPDSVVNKNITIKGSKDAVVEMLSYVTATNSTIAFEGITANFGYTYMNGLQHATTLTYTDCTLNGTQYLYASTVDFTNCTFNVTGDNYNVWTWGAHDVTFTGCTFNTEGKAVLLYGYGPTDLALNNCTFKSEKTAGKAAVEVGNDYGATYTLDINNCAADATFVANNSTSNLWGNKNSMDWQHLNVVIDGEDVTTPHNVSITAGGKTVYYGNLQSAIDAATAGQTITLLVNETINAEDGKPDTHAWVKADDNVIIDLNGHTVTGAFYISGTAAIKNGTIVNNSMVSCIESVGNLTLESVTATSDRHAVRVDGGTVKIVSGTYTTTAGSSTSGYALNIKGGTSAATVTVEGGKFYGSANGSVTGKSAVTVQKATDTIIINGGEFYSAAASAPAYSVENYSGTSKIMSGTFHGSLVNAYNNIYGGTFSADPTAQLAENHRAVDNGDGTWTVEKLPVVATIGTTEYFDLAKAFEDLKAAGGGTITLTENATIAVTNWPEMNFDNLTNNTVIEGNGATITGLTNPLIFSHTTGTSTLTIKDLTIADSSITSTTTSHTGAHTAGAFLGVAGYHAVTLENCHLKDSTVSSQGFAGGLIGYDATGSALLTISGCSVTGSTVESSDTGENSSTGAMVGHTNTNVTVSGTVGGNTINSAAGSGWQGSVIGVVAGTGNTIHVTETSKSTSSNPLYVVGGLLQDVSYTGGAYYTDPRTHGNNQYYTSSSAIPAPGYTFAESNGMFKVEKLPDVAKIGDTAYYSLQMAIDAATAGQTITLVGNVTESGLTVATDDDVIIDLNGKTVTGDFMVYGKATIKNGTIDSNDPSVSAIESNGASSNVTVEDVTITSERHAIRVDGGTVTIDGGSYTASNYASTHAVNISDGGKVTIKDGTFVGNTQNGSACIALRDASSLVIENGTFTGGAADLGTLTVWGNGGNATVKGGSFDTVYADVAISIEGGDFNTVNKMVNKGISGGTFTNPINTDYVADGYAIVQLANKRYTVAKLPDGVTDITKKMETKTITIEWKDDNNSRKLRPSQVTVTLYADGVQCGNAYTVTAQDGNVWTLETLEVPVYADNSKTRAAGIPTEIVYTVKQNAVGHYTTTANGLNITNTYKAPTIYIYSPNKLLQTGAELLPIGMMMLAGISVLAAGMWLLRKKSYER